VATAVSARPRDAPDTGAVEVSEVPARKKQFLTATEVEANPAILRHPDARQKRRNRSGQRAGISKEHIPGPFAWRLIEMMESSAYRALSLSARRVLDRIEIEFERHGRNPFENGDLPCTYEDFEKYGLTPTQIAPAIREAVALGFIRITRKGSAGNADHRQATLFLLTYRHAGSDARIENSWRRIKTPKEAEAIAKAARNGKADPRARAFGRKGAWARWAKDGRKNRKPVMETIVKLGMETIVKGGQEGADTPDSLTMESIALSRLSLGWAELDPLPWASVNVGQASGQFRCDDFGVPPSPLPPVNALSRAARRLLH
jgi:hypothetical protein